MSLFYLFWRGGGGSAEFLVIVINIIVHPKLPPPKTILFGFGFCLLSRPSVMGNTVCCNDGSRSVGAAFTMNKNGLVTGRIYQFQDVFDLRVLRREPVIKRNIVESD